jgi:Xaa-Pro aminopeptidase
VNIEKRIKKIQHLISQRNLAALIAVRYPCIGYLTGVYQRWGSAALIIPGEKPIICSAEIDRVRDEAWDPELLEFVSPAMPTSVVYYSRIEAIVDEVKRKGLDKERLGIEKAYLTAMEFEKIKLFLAKAEFINADDLIPGIMLVKDHEEIKILKKLAGIADAGLTEALKRLRVGVTELEVSGLIDLAMKRVGGEKTWFPTHVASGYRSNFNMAYPTDKVIQYGDKVALDMGPMLQLYCGQLNGQVIVGKALPEYKKLFEGAARMLQTIFDSLQPGKKASEIFRIMEEKSKALGYSRVSPHFGRGIGIIDNEELLTFSPQCETVLVPGMVLAIITYVRDDKNLISNERMVQITENGGQWLCSYPLELIEI